MSGRDRQRDPAADVDDPVREASRDERGGGDQLRDRLGQGSGSILSGRGLALSFVFVTAGVVAVGSVVPVVGVFAGIVLAALVFGTVSDARQHVELAVAGGVVGGASALFGTLGSVLSALGPWAVGVGAVGGVAAALGGHYFGRDLRDGLTREI